MKIFTVKMSTFVILFSIFQLQAISVTNLDERKISLQEAFENCIKLHERMTEKGSNLLWWEQNGIKFGSCAKVIALYLKKIEQDVLVNEQKKA